MCVFFLDSIMSELHKMQSIEHYKSNTREKKRSEMFSHNVLDSILFLNLLFDSSTTPFICYKNSLFFCSDI